MIPPCPLSKKKTWIEDTEDPGTDQKHLVGGIRDMSASLFSRLSQVRRPRACQSYQSSPVMKFRYHPRSPARPSHVLLGLRNPDKVHAKLPCARIGIGPTRRRPNVIRTQSHHSRHRHALEPTLRPNAAIEWILDARCNAGNVIFNDDGSCAPSWLGASAHVVRTMYVVASEYFFSCTCQEPGPTVFQWDAQIRYIMTYYHTPRIHVPSLIGWCSILMSSIPS